MENNKNILISYAIDCASYLIANTRDIITIILHGSSARGDSDENSDIDLFVHTKNNKLRKEITEHLNNYYKTAKFKNWQLRGIENPISIITGDINSREWADLKRAIMNTGIVLYGKYTDSPKKTKQYTLFSIENIKPDKKRVSIFRKLFGFKLKNKTYPGLASKMNIKKIGKNCLIVPIEYTNELKTYFQEKKVAPKVYDLWSDQEF